MDTRHFMYIIYSFTQMVPIKKYINMYVLKSIPLDYLYNTPVIQQF